MTEFFKFTSSRSNVYAPTILNKEDHFLLCKKCGARFLKNRQMDVDLLIEGKGKLPDMLMCGSFPLFIVSPKVVDCWEQNGITGYRSSRARLFRKVNKELVEEDVCYRNVEITGRAELDFEKMGVQVTVCSVCGSHQFNKNTWEFGEAIYKPNSWDGSDLFVFTYFEYSPLCGMKNLEVIYKNKLTNFCFMKMEDKFNYASSQEVDLKAMFGRRNKQKFD